MVTLRRTKLKGWFELYREACPICGHTGMCMINEDNNRVVCCRQASDIDWGKNSSMPGWLHFLNDDNRPKIEFSHADIQNQQEKKDDGHLNRVYRALLSETELRKEHIHMLMKPERDMTLEEMQTRQYRSFPERPFENVKRIIERVGSHEDIIGVPGFFSKEGRYGRYFTLSGFSESLLIPFRNHKNEIVGFQWRVDQVRNQITYKKRINNDFVARVIEQPNVVTVQYKGNEIFRGTMKVKETKSFYLDNRNFIGEIKLEKGTRYMWLSSANKDSGTGAGPLPVHVAVPTRMLKQWKVGTLLKAETVIITEGPIKADKSAEMLDKLLLTREERESYGTVVLSVPGVNSWKILYPILKEMGVKSINFAFDMDAEDNPNVRYHYKEAMQSLYNIGYDVNVFLWNHNDFKGLDDLVISRLLPVKVNVGEINKK